MFRILFRHGWSVYYSTLFFLRVFHSDISKLSESPLNMEFSIFLNYGIMIMKRHIPPTMHNQAWLKFSLMTSVSPKPRLSTISRPYQFEIKNNNVGKTPLYFGMLVFWISNYFFNRMQKKYIFNGVPVSLTKNYTLFTCFLVFELFHELSLRNNSYIINKWSNIPSHNYNS